MLLLQAPMAGCSDYSFRALCALGGADVCVTEMVSARGLLESPRMASLERILSARSPLERFHVVQLFGDDPGLMAEAADVVLGWGGVDGIDINFGCPVRKIARSDSGAVLMRSPARAARIMRRVASVCRGRAALSIKIRLGWSPAEPAAFRFVEIAAEEGVDYVVLHPRWATQMYRGSADYGLFADVAARSPLPVIPSGDVIDAAALARAVDACGGRKYAMIGRAALKAPMIFRALRNVLEGGAWVAPSAAARLRWAERLIRLDLALDARLAAAGVERTPPCVRRRGVLCRMAGDFPGASALRRELVACSSDERLLQLLRDARARPGG